MARGFISLMVVIDWYSRCVLAWRLSNTLDSAVCVDALEEALGRGRPELFNTDQGTQSPQRYVHQALEGTGRSDQPRWRWPLYGQHLRGGPWRSLKYEEVYLKAYEQVPEARVGIGRYLWS